MGIARIEIIEFLTILVKLRKEEIYRAIIEYKICDILLVSLNQIIL